MYKWYNENSRQFMTSNGGYLLPGQTLEERIDIIANYAAKILDDPSFVNDFKERMSKGFYSLSTPIWCNFGTDRGFGISCFGTYIEDSMESILYTQAEIGMMSKYGGGTAGYFGKVRPRGSSITNNGHSSGSVHFMRLFDNISNIVSQGNSRRGHFAAYLPIDHGDIEEFLTIREEGSPIQDISFAVCVPTKWVNEMREGDADKRRIWAKVLQRRSEVGYPYIFFTDNVNKGAADVYVDKGMKITHSQMCSEITLPSDADNSFVCNLASFNMMMYDEIKKDPLAGYTIVRLLDAVQTDFIERASKVKFMERAVNFAKTHRALGIGQLGWHSYLQSKMIPFESMEAKLINAEAAKHFKEITYAASERMGKKYGVPELLKDYGRRHATLLAIAPNTSSAFILGQVSQSIEPWNSNYFVKDLAKIKYTVKNEHLKALLETKSKDTKEVWRDILMHGGSVQHLDFLNEHEKNVFKTFGEISQKEIIIQAAQRQKYIDQAQSLNLMIHPNTPTKDINELMLFAHDQGIKTLYYQHSTNAAQEFSRDLLNCVNCE